MQPILEIVMYSKRSNYAFMGYFKVCDQGKVGMYIMLVIY